MARHARAFASLPPHEVLSFPSLSPTMNQGNITKWHKQVGDTVAPGDVLCEIETDKATLDWEAQEEGILAKILVPEGAKDIPVGTVVGVLVEEPDEVAAMAGYTAEGGAAAAAAAAPDAGASGSGGAAAAEEGPTSSGGDFPAHTVAGMPALSPTMSQGNISEWKVQVGDEIGPGDVICVVETDKATIEWEAQQEEGFVARILVPDGSNDVAVGKPVLVLVDDKDDVAAFASFTAADAGGAGAAPKAAAPPAPAAAPAAAAPPAPKAAPAAPAAAAPPPAARAAGERVVASPYARRLAEEKGVPLAGVAGSGPGGRLVAADVAGYTGPAGGAAPPGAAAAVAGVVGGPDFTDVPLTQIRRVVAQRLTESKQQVPHYYLTIDVDMSKLGETRAKLNETLAKQGGKVSVNDFVVKASALALREVPEMNASWHGDYIRQYGSVDMSIAVQTERGLFVPVVRAAHAKGLGTISQEIRELAGRAKEGKLHPSEMSGGTFSISNLGMFGVKQFSAVINPPQAGILAVGAPRDEVVMTPDGGFRTAPLVSVTLSADHRVVDGVAGARWLQAFKKYMEDPVTMLL